jgi:hypothetical protein
MKADKVYEIVVAKPAPREVGESLPVPHWLDSRWQYQPAATHGDSSAFAARQKERAQRIRK